ncbi:MAG: hypothetical protein AAFX06_04060 [Planctomycetota bacterium]
MSTPRVLVVSGTIPNEPGVGGVILEDLRKGLPEGTLGFYPAVSSAAQAGGWMDKTPPLIGQFARRYEPAYRPLKGIAGEWFAWLARKAKFERHCQSAVNQICSDPAATNCERVWAILDCPTAIEIAKPIASKLGKPLSVLVWDAPELLSEQLRMDRWSIQTMMSRFGETIRSAESVGVICEQMEDAYQQRYGENDYIILRHGIDSELCFDPRSEIEQDRITIGFAGSITARQPFDRLIELLDANEWRLADREVTLRLIGSRYVLDSRKAQHIEYYGWRSLKDTVKLLAECTFSYLPQPFAATLRPLAELSFPTKLTTYIAAGRRVLLHAPKYGSVTPFLKRHPIGVSCETLNLDDMHTSIEDLLCQPAEPLAEAILRCRAGEFSSDVFQSRFRTLARL